MIDEQLIDPVLFPVAVPLPTISTLFFPPLACDDADAIFGSLTHWRASDGSTCLQIEWMLFLALGRPSDKKAAGCGGNGSFGHFYLPPPPPAVLSLLIELDNSQLSLRPRVP